MDDELVERQVAVERVDDPVAIAPGLGQLATGGAGLRVGVVVVGVADHVEPVPRPALAVGRRGQQPIDDLLERLGRTIRKERRDLVRRRRQAGQVERRAADPGPPVRRSGGRDPLRTATPPGGRHRSHWPRRRNAVSTAGGGSLRTGWNAHQPRWAAVGSKPPVVVGPVVEDGQGAPDATQRSSAAISPADSFCFGGIFGSSRYRTARISRLSSGAVRNDSRSALAPFEKRFSVRQPEAGLRFLFTVARLAFLRRSAGGSISRRTRSPLRRRPSEVTRGKQGGVLRLR